MKIIWKRGTLSYPDTNVVNLLLIYLKKHEIVKITHGKLVQLHKKIGKITGNELLANGINVFDKDKNSLILKLKDVDVTLQYTEMDKLYTLDKFIIQSF